MIVVLALAFGRIMHPQFVATLQDVLPVGIRSSGRVIVCSVWLWF